MHGEPDGTYLWKPISAPMPPEECRAEVRRQAERGPIAPVGLIGWYTVPHERALWVGCLPEGYSPYEPR